MEKMTRQDELLLQRGRITFNQQVMAAQLQQIDQELVSLANSAIVPKPEIKPEVV